MTFKGLPLLLFQKIISKSIDPILRFERFQNGRLGLPKIANCEDYRRKVVVRA